MSFSICRVGRLLASRHKSTLATAANIHRYDTIHFLIRPLTSQKQHLSTSSSCARRQQDDYDIQPLLRQRQSGSDKKSGRNNFVDTIKARDVQPEDGLYGSLGEEISGAKLEKSDIILHLNKFYQMESVRDLAKTHYIDQKLFNKAFTSFRRYCYQSLSLPPELHIVFCDIIKGHKHHSDLYPFFLSHARSVYPHLECMQELRKISDLGLPHTWYPQAREKQRKIIFHAGPTNSGKTYHAMERFMKASSGIYCGPLKLLAVENFNKANANNTPCDLVTGEERRYADPAGQTKANHVSCTVEMTQVTEPVEVVVIDEIQMLRDPARGWAWTRALLGIPADEVHLCGEEAAVDLVRNMLMPTGDIFEVVRYNRLTPLVIEEKPLGELTNIRSGDCIVCFNRDSIYQVTSDLERLGHQVAVVYGTMPPGAKLAQCAKFNKLENCQVMVATDAIGMGLNLSIGRVIFHSLMKTTADEKGNRSMEYLSTSQCLQIAGRAGRFNTHFGTGYVTTWKSEDLRSLREIMARGVKPIEKAGLHPTAEQIELFAYHLPHLGLTDLIELFVDICEFDSSAYFICDLENFKLLAKAIEHINVPLRARFVFCCAPINTKVTFALSMFTKFVRQFSVGEPISAAWVKNIINWPCKPPQNLEDLHHLEAVYDVFELYLWLSYRFQTMFFEPDEIRAAQTELDNVVYEGVANLVDLLRKAKPQVQSRFR